jgi:hypothetical protein
MDPNDGKAMLDWPRWTNQKEVQQLSWLWNFYCRFVLVEASIVSPIMNLLGGNDNNITWGDIQQAALRASTPIFITLNIPILCHNNSKQPTLVKTNRSDIWIADILSQQFEHRMLRPVSWISRKLSPAKLNYKVFDNEILAILLCLT